MVAARKLIRTAQVTVEVASWEEAAGRLATVVESSDGYVADTRLRVEGDRRRGTITRTVRFVVRWRRAGKPPAA
jgi:hypothetical protein